MHFADISMYEHDLLQPFDDLRSFHAAPDYAYWQIENSLYSVLVVSLCDEQGVYERRINDKW
jgi:hypothetical protein